MTAGERDELLRRTHEAVLLIANRCEVCQRRLEEHQLILDGQPGNGANSGLRGRVTGLEQRENTRLRVLTLAATVSAIVAGLVGSFGAVLLRWTLGIGG